MDNEPTPRKNGDTLMAILALAVVLGILLFAIALFVTPLPSDSRDIILMIATALVARVGDVYTYYFGSSRGSDLKTDMLNNRQ